MPSGSYWPNMNCTVDVWKGDEDGHGISWRTGDTLAVYRTSTDWSSNGFRRNVASTCRESMSVGMKDIAADWSLLFKENFDNSIRKRVTLDIGKRPPSIEWMTCWKSLWVFPDLITRYITDSSGMRFTLNNKFIAQGAPQPVFSFPFFFTNRHEAFTPEVLSDPDKVVQQILKNYSVDGYWGGSSTSGEMAFSHAFAAYMWGVIGNRDSFYKVIPNCNGIGQYMLKETCISQPQYLVEFVKKYNINVNNYLSSNGGGSRSGMTVPQIINAMRASSTVPSNPSAW